MSSYNLLRFFAPLVNEKLVVGVVSKSQAGIVELGEGNRYQIGVSPV